MEGSATISMNIREGGWQGIVNIFWHGTDFMMLEHLSVKLHYVTYSFGT